MTLATATATQPAALTEQQERDVSLLLRLWHAWSKASSRASRGYARTSPGFESYRCSRQYDDQNGAFDDVADMEMARAVDDIVRMMPDPWRTALHIEARNVDAPARVWASARLAGEDVARVTKEARAMLWRGLKRAYLVE